MKFKEDIKKRSEKIQKFLKGNLISTIVSIVAIVVIISSGFFSTNNSEKSVKLDTNSKQEQQTEKETSHFRIYISDYVVLFGSIAFCTVMIIRRNFKSKENI